MITLKTFLRSNRAKSRGEGIIYFRVGPEWISTEIKIHPDHWDAENEIIKKSHPRYYQINPNFQQLKSRAEQCISNYQVNGRPFNRKYFTDYVFVSPVDAENPCFQQLIDEYCSIKDLSWPRVKHYNELKKDIAAVFSRPRLHQIDFKFLTRLKLYLKNKEQPNNENTITRKMKQIKAVIHFSQATGQLQADPLINFKLKQIKGNKKFLTAAELQTLENLYEQRLLDDACMHVLRYFLFSCYTGLRYSDIKKLEFCDIVNGQIQTEQEKTGKPVHVPLIQKAKDLLEIRNSGLCFEVYTNQATNRTLKDIMSAAGINKKITYHCSRHTFGTLSIYWGIPREVVAELMGIDESTVKIYAQIVNDVKTREMEKWQARAV